MRRPLASLASGLVGFALIVGPMVPIASAGVVHAPRIVVPRDRGGHGHGGGGGGSTTGWASSNWSGYAVTGSGFTQISGSWTVPSVASTNSNTYSSSWIGIDGFNNSSLIQTGTEQDWVNGAAQYYAWWEILPAPETVIPAITVHAGDQMSASIVQGGNGQWTITITDHSSGQSYSPPAQAYKGPQTSAEWIEEAPSLGGRVATLAHYSPTTFDPGTVNGNGNPNLAPSDGGVMIQHRVQVSTPSIPDSDTDGFAVQYGSTPPNQPPS